MSASPHRVWILRAMLSSAILTSGACHRPQPTALQPRVVDRRFAGVDIVRTRQSGFVVRINSAMVGDGDPLYVIDGTPMKIPPNLTLEESARAIGVSLATAKRELRFARAWLARELKGESLR